MHEGIVIPAELNPTSASAGYIHTNESRFFPQSRLTCALTTGETTPSSIEAS